MLKAVFIVVLSALSIHLAVKGWQYHTAAKVNSRVVSFQEERGGFLPEGGNAPSMDIACVSYQLGGMSYREPIRDAWLFEYSDTGQVVPLIINPVQPNVAVANGVFTFWLRVQVIVAILFGGLVMLGLLNVYSAYKNRH